MLTPDEGSELAEWIEQADLCYPGGLSIDLMLFDWLPWPLSGFVVCGRVNAECKHVGRCDPVARDVGRWIAERTL